MTPVKGRIQHQALDRLNAGEGHVAEAWLEVALGQIGNDLIKSNALGLVDGYCERNDQWELGTATGLHPSDKLSFDREDGDNRTPIVRRHECRSRIAVENNHDVKGNDDPGSQPAALDNLGVRLV